MLERVSAWQVYRGCLDPYVFLSGPVFLDAAGTDLQPVELSASSSPYWHPTDLYPCLHHLVYTCTGETRIEAVTRGNVTISRHLRQLWAHLVTSLCRATLTVRFYSWSNDQPFSWTNDQPFSWTNDIPDNNVMVGHRWPTTECYWLPVVAHHTDVQLIAGGPAAT